MGCGASNVAEIGFRQKVVVLGGGYAGTAVAKQLDRYFDVTLVDRQNYHTHSIGVLRAATNKTYAPLVLVPFDKLLKNGKVVQGEITEITSSTVTIANGQTSRTLNFDFLVVATGSAMPFPCRPAATDAREAVKELESCSSDIASAKRVLIVGGGAVGVELAAEIKYAQPQKSVTLVHSGDKLCANALSGKFYTTLHEKLTKLGVDVRLNEKVTLPDAMQGKSYYKGPEVTLQSSAGQSYQADVIFKCTGVSPATAHLQYFAARGAVDTAGRIKVNEYLQVEGHSNIFALGDCCNTAEQKLAYLAGKHALVVAANVRAVSRAGKPAKRYAAAPKQAMIVPIGEKDGLGELGGSILPTFLVVMLKSKNVMVPSRWKDMGYPEINGVTPDKAATAPLAAPNRATPTTARILALA